MNFIKVEAIERIVLTLPQEILPFDLIRDVEHFLNVKNSVIHLVAYQGNKYCLTVCSSAAVEKLLSRDKILIQRRKCFYKVVEKRLTRIKILQPPMQVRSHQIDDAVKHYGKILYSEFEKRGHHSYYFALIDLKKPVPEKISLKHRTCDVVCF